jgi:hypothetical protein
MYKLTIVCLDSYKYPVTEFIEFMSLQDLFLFMEMYIHHSVQNCEFNISYEK